MGTIANISLSDAGLTALRFISAYRYLSVSQVATITGLRPKSVSEMLLKMERQKLLGFFGNTGVRGYGKTPKVYFLTKTGHSLLEAECAHMGVEIEPYRQVSVNSRWSPMMYHRLATLDVMMALERDCADLSGYQLVRTFVEYRREKLSGNWRRETTDYVERPEVPANRIVPDAGFILENVESGKRALFLIEVDCGMERLTTKQADALPQSFSFKLNQYDRYLASKRVQKRYEAWGDFGSFVLLIITDSAARVNNMRHALTAECDARFHRFYRFSTLNEVTASILHSNWLSRDSADTNAYSLIRGG